MQPSAVQPVGMALHELGTNAGKYGALSNDAGRVDISWDVGNGGSVLQMAWREHGGPDVIKPERKGFGSTVIDGVVRCALDASIKIGFQPSGVSWLM